MLTRTSHFATRTFDAFLESLAKRSSTHWQVEMIILYLVMWPVVCLMTLWLVIALEPQIIGLIKASLGFGG